MFLGFNAAALPESDSEVHPGAGGDGGIAAAAGCADAAPSIVLPLNVFENPCNSVLLHLLWSTGHFPPSLPAMFFMAAWSTGHCCGDAADLL